MPGRGVFSSFRRGSSSKPQAPDLAEIKAVDDAFAELFSRYLKEKEDEKKFFMSSALQDRVGDQRQRLQNTIENGKKALKEIENQRDKNYREGNTESHGFAVTLQHAAINDAKATLDRSDGHLMRADERRLRVGFENDFAKEIEEFLAKNKALNYTYNRDLGGDTSHARENMRAILKKIESMLALATAAKGAKDTLKDRAPTDTDQSTASTATSASDPPKSKSQKPR